MTAREASAVELRDLLARILATDRPTYETGWGDGYRVGYAAGWDVGYGRARVQQEEDWRRMAERIARRRERPAVEHPHGDLWWQRYVKRHGEYRGGPVVWDARGAA